LPDAFVGSIKNKMTREEYEGVAKSVEEVIKTKKPLPSKTLDELMKAVTEADNNLARQKAELESKHATEIATLRETLKKEAADEVSNDFLTKLAELAKK